MTDREALQIAFNALAAIDRETPYPIAKHAIKCINAVFNTQAQSEQDHEFLNALRAVHEVQGYDGNCNDSPYMLGTYNGLELALSIAERREPVFKTAPSKWMSGAAKPTRNGITE